MGHAVRDRGLRARLSRLAQSQEALDAQELEDRAAASGAGLVSDCRSGEPTTVCGRLRAVTLRPGQQTPVVEAQLFDGTGEITLAFLGRRTIPGITAGRLVVASGRPIVKNGKSYMVNPRYELLPQGGE